MTEARKQYLKIWRFENVEKCRAQRRKWVKKNPVKVKDNLDKWLAKNIEKWRAYHANWRALNKEKIMGHNLKWLSSRPERTIFHAFASLDEMIRPENLMLDSLTPADMLMMKEDYLNETIT